jgi:hypothetical protein
MATKRSKRPELSEWSRRLLGVVLCTFFGLGVLVGARMGVQRTSGWLGDATRRARQLAAEWTQHERGQQASTFAGASIALVRRGTKFYALTADGTLSGPTTTATEADLPVLSGPPIENAPGSALLDYAALIVRAEAALSQTVSELQVAPDGTVKIFLAASPTEVIVEPSKAASELARAGWVMRRWRGREKLIAALDVTMADAVAVRLYAPARAPQTRHNQTYATGARTSEGAGRGSSAMGRTAKR